MVVHDGKAANRRRYIATDYTMLHNVVQFYHIMLHNFASGGEKVSLGSVPPYHEDLGENTHSVLR